MHYYVGLILPILIIDILLFRQSKTALQIDFGLLLDETFIAN